MAEPLTPIHPLERFRAPFAALSAELGDRLTVALEPDSTTQVALTLRLPSSGAALWAASDVLGRPLPVDPRAWSDLGDGARAHRLGPDEWLVTLPAEGPAAGGEHERRLAAALRHHDGHAVDVSAQRTSLTLAGSDARDLLAFGCSLDLRPRVFSPGACAQTVLWRAPALLAADAAGLRILVRPSFGAHLAERLLDAAQELRADPARPLAA